MMSSTQKESNQISREELKRMISGKKFSWSSSDIEKKEINKGKDDGRRGSNADDK